MGVEGFWVVLRCWDCYNIMGDRLVVGGGGGLLFWVFDFCGLVFVGVLCIGGLWCGLWVW